MLHQTSLADRATAYDVAECAIEDLIRANPGTWPTRTEAAGALIVHLISAVAELVADDSTREAELAVAFADRLQADVRFLYKHP